MRTSSIASVIFALLAGCTPNSEAEPSSPTSSKSTVAPPPTEAPTPTPTATASASAANGSTSSDRRGDPAFALREENGKYIGRVADACPWVGEAPADPQLGAVHAIPTIKEADYKLVDGHLEVTLFFGGCPGWAGYTVVPGKGSPLPFYVCAEVRHDLCELSGRKTWVFDISAALKTNQATSVTFAVPAGVR